MSDIVSTLSSGLKELLPNDAYAHLVSIESCEERLFPEEEALLSKAVEKRIREFKSGRHCARNCLKQFGVQATPILNDKSRAPIWPNGFTGSITHTDKIAATVVAKKSKYVGIGIDIEETNRITTEIWTEIYLPEEIKVIQALKTESSLHPDTIIFSAKETFFKQQYPLSLTWLDFMDVNINLNINNQTFTVDVRKRGIPDYVNLTGYFRTYKEAVLTFIYTPA